LEILLHDVLDEEVDTAPPPEQALLPNVLSFLSSFPQYLDIVVQCTRKTEVRSWRTLFAHLPPPQDLFEESLQRGSLKTAGGYLLVLHTFDENSASSRQTVRLLRRAKEEEDWDLCKELARFLMALDESGETLREAMSLMELKSPTEEGGPGGRFRFPSDTSSLLSPMNNMNGLSGSRGWAGSANGDSRRGSESRTNGSSHSLSDGPPSPQTNDRERATDYFSSGA
jgi:RAB6A-GEF complex partner protein 1